MMYRLYVGYCLDYRPRLKRVDFTSTVLDREMSVKEFEVEEPSEARLIARVASSTIDLCFADSVPDVLLVQVDLEGKEHRVDY